MKSNFKIKVGDILDYKAEYASKYTRVEITEIINEPPHIRYQFKYYYVNTTNKKIYHYASTIWPNTFRQLIKEKLEYLINSI